MSDREERGGRTPTFRQAVKIHKLLYNKEYQHDIAAKYGFNQGRVSEVKTGKSHPGSKEVACIEMSE